MSRGQRGRHFENSNHTHNSPYLYTFLGGSLTIPLRKASLLLKDTRIGTSRHKSLPDLLDVIQKHISSFVYSEGPSLGLSHKRFSKRPSGPSLRDSSRGESSGVGWVCPDNVLYSAVLREAVPRPGQSNSFIEVSVRLTVLP